MEGKSLRTVFQEDQMEERHLLFEHESNAAIRKGDWKLVGIGVVRDDSTLTEKWELYNIREDRSEMNDLSDQFPDKFAELRELFEKEAKRVRFFPSKFGRAE
jgi:arylsulfatase